MQTSQPPSASARRGSQASVPISPTSARFKPMNALPVAPPSARRTSRLYQDPLSTPRGNRADMAEPPTGSASSARSGRMTSARRVSTMDIVSSLQKQGNAMKVYVRVRPFSEREIAASAPVHSTVRIDPENPGCITLLDPHMDYRTTKTFTFTRCFWSVFESDDSTSAAMKNSVDVYLNKSAPADGDASGRRRSRAQSMQSVQGMPPFSGRRRTLAADLVSEASQPNLPYAGAGSNAQVVSGGSVSHPPYSGQDDVYKYVGRPILETVLEGYNGCIFAYGQTGSGKTFTMMGYAPKASDVRHERNRRESMAPAGGVSADFTFGTDPQDDPEASRVTLEDAEDETASAAEEETPSLARTASPRDAEVVLAAALAEADEQDIPADVVNTDNLDPNELQGVIPRICSDLFRSLRARREEDASRSYRVEVSYYEIFNEKVFDLIKSQKDVELKIRNNPTTGPFVDGLSVKVVHKEEDIAKVIRRGAQERHTAQTTFNNRSSRSHAIINVTITQLYLDGTDNTTRMQSKLNLVDLAGSERTGQAGVEGEQKKVSIKINLSLTTLGRVIDCLANLSQNRSLGVPVPYRDSNLTWLLSDSIGGNSQTSMIATISPHTINYEEMKQTLQYASRAKEIINTARINEDPQVQQIRLLTAEVERLRQVVEDSGSSGYTKAYVKDLEKQVKHLKKKVADQEQTIASLRAELEVAGLLDPTLSSNNASGELKTAAIRKLEEDHRNVVEQLQLEATQLRTELDHRAEIEPEKLAALEKALEKRDMTIASLRKDQQDSHHLFQDYSNRLDALLNTVEDKENIFIRSCTTMMLSTNTESTAVAERLGQQRERELEELKRRHEQELQDQEETFKTKLKENLAVSEEQQKALSAKHAEALAQMDGYLKRNKEVYDQDKQRMEREKDEYRNAMGVQINAIRAQYQEELERLRQRLENDAAGRHQASDQVRELQALHEKELARMQEEMDRLKRNKESEISRLKSQLENESLRRQSDMMEKDRQRRMVEVELSEARREVLKVSTEKNRMENEYQDQIRDLIIQQDQLMAISNSVLSDWENKSSTMEVDMSKLRALIYDQDYLNYRQKMRDLAFAERRDYDKEMQEVEERGKRKAEHLQEIVSKVKKNKEETNQSLQRFMEKKQAGRSGLTPTHSGPPTPRPVAAEAPTAVAPNGTSVA